MMHSLLLKLDWIILTFILTMNTNNLPDARAKLSAVNRILAKL